MNRRRISRSSDSMAGVYNPRDLSNLQATSVICVVQDWDDNNGIPIQPLCFNLLVGISIQPLCFNRLVGIRIQPMCFDGLVGIQIQLLCFNRLDRAGQDPDPAAVTAAVF